METFAALNNMELTTSSQFPTTDLQSKKTKWLIGICVNHC